MKFAKLCKIGLAVGAAVGLVHAAHALTLDRRIAYKNITFRDADVPVAMDGYKIAFITDTHELSAVALQAVADTLNRQQLDLLVLGGDFSGTDNAAWRSMAILSQIETTDGAFGVEGNHDRHTDLFAAMEAHGIVPLSNSGLYIREGFFLAGVEDLFNRNPSVQTAIDGSQPEDFVLLLAHNPDITMLQATTGVDLVLSGHTHGGQITFFGVWAPYFTFRKSITQYGQRFRSGWARSNDGVPVYVSNGTGSYLVRVFARPQVILLTLRHA